MLISFMFYNIMPPWARAQTFLNLPAPGAKVALSPVFEPAIIKGIRINPQNPLQFDFIVDPADSGFKAEALKEESTKLIKYFLAALTVPEADLWVNLSPYEKDRIIPEAFGYTEMGRDLLAQDYILKQITASLMYPEDELGEKFWGRVYAKSRQEYGVMDILENTFNKVWIVPEKAVVYESGDTAFVVESKLKVMLEEDYFVWRQADVAKAHGHPGAQEQGRASARVTSVIREILIPEIEKEVNLGKNFAQLRQIYHSMILATWFKRRLKGSFLGQVYVGKNKVGGVEVEDKQVKLKIYNQYLTAFNKGVYDYIKEDYDPTTRQIIPRKYFSGGANLGRKLNETMMVTGNSAGLKETDNAVLVSAVIKKFEPVHRPGRENTNKFTHFVQQRDALVLKNEGDMLTQVGPCVAVLIHAPDKLIAGMAHFDALTEDLNHSTDRSLYLFVKEMEAAGADLQKVQIHIIGGMDGESEELVNNIEQSLEEMGLNSKVTEKDVLGKAVRGFTFNVRDGKVRNFEGDSSSWNDRVESEERISLISKSGPIQIVSKYTSEQERKNILNMPSSDFWGMLKEMKLRFAAGRDKAMLSDEDARSDEKIIFKPEDKLTIDEVSFKIGKENQIVYSDYGDKLRHYAIGREFSSGQLVILKYVNADSWKGVERIINLLQNGGLNLERAAKIIAFGETPAGHAVLATEYLPVEFKKYIEEAKLDGLTGGLKAGIENGLALGRDLLKLKERGLEHGDLQYHNVMLKDGEWKLIDFGDGMDINDVEGLASLLYAAATGRLLNFLSGEWMVVNDGPTRKAARLPHQINDSIPEKLSRLIWDGLGLSNNKMELMEFQKSLEIFYNQLTWDDVSKKWYLRDSVTLSNEGAKGGIDLNPASMNLETKGRGIDLDFTQSGLPCLDEDGDGRCEVLDFEQIKQMNINGFSPVIIQMTPVPSLLLLLGIKEEESEVDNFAGLGRLRLIDSNYSGFAVETRIEYIIFSIYV
jgi:chemotaxis receptor (MCP) glutamine deamidase CheD